MVPPGCRGTYRGGQLAARRQFRGLTTISGNCLERQDISYPESICEDVSLTDTQPRDYARAIVALVTSALLTSCVMSYSGRTMWCANRTQIRRLAAYTSRRPLLSSYHRLHVRYGRLILVPLMSGGLALYSFWPFDPAHADQLPPFPKKSHLTAIEEQTTLIASQSEPELLTVQRFLRVLNVYIWEPLLTARRFIHLCLLFIPVAFASPLLLVGSTKDNPNGERMGAIWWYGFLTRQMQRAGPTFVKLGQWAASRTDLFSSALCQRMGALHSHGKAHSFPHTRNVIESAFNRQFSEVFEQFEHDPIGVGAIAQVYRAVLKSDLVPSSHLAPRRSRDAHLPIPYPLPLSIPTASVAIKILHPRVEKLISRDLSIMTFFANLISLVPGMQWLSLPEEVNVFGKMMREQIDLRNEATNLATFERNFGTRKAAVTFPRPVKEFCSQNILIEEFENALPLELFLSNGGGPFDDQIAQIGLDAFLNMLLLDNFVHSDLHPGNIMVKFYKPSTRYILRGVMASLFHAHPPEDSTHTAETERIVSHLRELSKKPTLWRSELDKLASDGYQPELVFIDTGLVTELDDKNRHNFLDLFSAIAQFDGYKAGKLMVERCRSPELAIETETFALKIQHLVLKVKSETFSLRKMKISDVLSQILQAVREHHVKMEGDFINTVLSVLLLEGIGRQLDPDLDLFRSSLPILRKLGRQMSIQESIANLPRSNLGAMLKARFSLCLENESDLQLAVGMGRSTLICVHGFPECG